MRLYFKEGVGTAFWAGVKSGAKTHTCRKKAAKVGGPLTLICGAERLAVTCAGVQSFAVEAAPYGPIVLIDGNIMPPKVVDGFCARSGFASRDAMFDYYGEGFKGFIIHWGNDFYEGIH